MAEKPSPAASAGASGKIHPAEKSGAVTIRGRKRPLIPYTVTDAELDNLELFPPISTVAAGIGVAVFQAWMGLEKKWDSAGIGEFGFVLLCAAVAAAAWWKTENSIRRIRKSGLDES